MDIGFALKYSQVEDIYYCYDISGNPLATLELAMTKRVEGGVTTTQNFNVENELSSVVVGSNTTSFSYDAAGMRVKSVEPGGKTTYYPFPGYEEEVIGSTTNRRITYMVAGQAVALRTYQPVGSPSTLTYLHSDHLGSTSLATTDTGALVPGSTARYYPFGNWRTEPTAGLTDRGFTGHLHNNLGSAPEDIGLVYMAARWYSPTLGRFISADTIVPNPANPQSFNRYSYALNSPVKYVDPTGHMPSDGCEYETCLTDLEVSFPVCQKLDTHCVSSTNNLVHVEYPLPARDTTNLEQWISGGLDLVGTYFDIVELNISIAAISGEPVATAIGSLGGPGGAVLAWLVERMGADAVETLMSTPAFIASIGSSIANGTTYLDQDLEELIIGQDLLVDILEMGLDLLLPGTPEMDTALNVGGLYYDVIGDGVLDKIMYPLLYQGGFNLIQLRINLNSSSLGEFYWVAAD